MNSKQPSEISREPAAALPRSLKVEVDNAHGITGFNVQALIEGAKAIIESLDLGTDQRPDHVIRLLMQAKAGVQQLQDTLEEVGMNIHDTTLHVD